MKITITDIPIPPHALSPNARKHFRARAEAVKEQRAAAKICVYAEVAKLDNLESYGFPWSRVVVKPVWYRKTRREMDADNAGAMLKSTYDGFVDAELLNDDKYLVPMPVVFEHDPKNPRVEITVSQADDEHCPLCGCGKAEVVQ